MCVWGVLGSFERKFGRNDAEKGIKYNRNGLECHTLKLPERVEQCIGWRQTYTRGQVLSSCHLLLAPSVTSARSCKKKRTYAAFAQK